MPVAPKEVRDVAESALERRRRYGRGGTSVGVARARDIVNSVNLSMDTIRRMVSFFDRHSGNESENKARQDRTSAAAIAWDLWGGNPGRRWAARILREKGGDYER